MNKACPALFVYSNPIRDRQKDNEIVHLWIQEVYKMETVSVTSVIYRRPLRPIKHLLGTAYKGARDEILTFT